MTFGTILVHLDDTDRCAARVDIAAAWARSHDAHLVGVAAAGDGQLPLGYSTRAASMVAAQFRETLQNEARAACARFDERMRLAGMAKVETRIAESDAIAAITLGARYSDLVVVGQADSSEVARKDGTFVEQILLESGRPCLVVPYAGRFETVGSNVMVAWDAGRTAARAVSEALPVLRRAANVEVVVVNSDKTSGRHGGEPGADIALFLARHGVKVTVHQEVSTIDIGNTLLSRTADRGSDLLVMGAYGHSRFRELIMGGATRSILTQMTVPVLMTH